MDDGVDRSELTPEELAEARLFPLLIEWSAEDNAFIVSVPDLPGVHTHGATREEAAAMGDEVIAVSLTAMRNVGLSSPRPLLNATGLAVARDVQENVTAEEMTRARSYSMEIEWSPQDNAFIVSFPDAPDVKTHGATRVEAAEMGEDAIISWLTAMIDAGLPVPPPSPYSGSVTVEAPPPFDAGRIRELRRNFNVSQRVFAEMLNVSLGEVRAWEQGTRRPDGAAARLLGIAERHPAAILEAASLSEQLHDRVA